MNYDKTPGQLSTVSGSLLSIVATLDSTDIIKSCVLGTLGTVISYIVTKLLKALFEKSDLH